MDLAKRDLLAYLARVGETDAHGVTRAFGVSHSVAAIGLLRLVRQGLADRHRKAESEGYRYRLSERGWSRLLMFAAEDRGTA